MTVSNIKVKVQRKPTLKLKVLPRFPSNVTAASPILLDKTGGNFVISLEESSLGATLSPLNADNITLGSQTGTGAMVRAVNPTFPGQINVSPTAHTLGQGLVITQSGPTSGSVAGPTLFNVINASYNSTTTTTSGDPLAYHGDWTSVVNAFRVNFTVGGPNLGGQGITAGTFNVIHNANSVAGDKIGLVGTAYSTATESSGGLYGMAAGSFLDTGSSVPALVGIEIDIGMRNGGTAVTRAGLNIVNYLGTGQGSSIDTAIQIINPIAGGAFKNLVWLSNFSGQQAIDPTGNLFVQGSASTIGNIFNLSNMTVTGKILNFPNVTLDGPTGQLISTFSANSPVTHQIINTNAGTSAAAGFTASNAAASATFAMGGANFTLVPILQNRAYVFGNSATSGVVIDASGASNPILLATNDSERARVLLGLQVGTTSRDAAGVVNAGVGFNIAGTAASNHILLGNGTNYVDSATFPVASLGGLGTGVATALAVNVGSAGAFVTFNGALGTPSSGTLTSATGLPISTGLTGAGTGVLTALGVNVGTAGSVVVNGGALGTPSSGTVTNLTGTASININGTVGATTPTTGAFTTVATSTSETVPLVIGGSGAASTLTLESTSGAGTTDAVIFKTASQVEAGRVNTTQQWNFGPNVTINSGTKLTVNNNTLAVNNGGLSNVTMQVGSAVNALNRIEMAAVGSTPINVINFVSMGGTFGAPTATQSGTTMGAFGAFGFGATVFGGNAGASILFQTTQTWTDAAMGTALIFTTTPNGTTATANALIINASGGVSVGTASDPGVGGLMLKPAASITPAANGDLTFQATSNTSLTFKYKGSDGTVRSASLTLS